MTDLDLMLKLLLQLGIILVTCRAVGWFGQRFLGQTQVVMEMLAGVLLGPSLLGILAPQVQKDLFPKEFATPVIYHGAKLGHPSMSIIYCLSQIGLVFYMFLVGLEFDVDLLRKSAKSALAVSLAGIAAPFILGALLGLMLAGNTTFFAAKVAPLNGALYLGAALCITAFPMLARILFEQGIAQTSMGTLALASGASNDVVAWIMLAVVIAVNKGDVNYAAYAIGGGTLFALFLFTIAKRALALLGRATEKAGKLTPTIFLTMMVCVIFSAYITDAIGVYAVFGAFMAGAAMPKGQFAVLVRKQLELPVTVFFLPLFFVYSGLNTRIDMVDTPYLWGITGLVCAAAIVGKGLACALAAKASGQPWRESWAIGSLMNSRGLMELILVNIAKKAGVITDQLFTILVIMAVVTTLMASPLYRWIYGNVRASAEPVNLEAVAIPI
ncbi:MAG TPA: cation:proton antiporter [Fimbriimonas sp.]|nr:cation:proton antiporter [Fimbriimonas sp.]